MTKKEHHREQLVKHIILLLLGLTVLSTQALAERSRRIGGELTYLNTDVDIDVSGTNTESTIKRLDLELNFMWNFERFEVGPILQYLDQESGDTESKAIAIGVQAEYNILPNDGARDFVPGIGAAIGVGSYDESDDDDDFSGDYKALSVYIFGKFFIPSTSWAFMTSLALHKESSLGDINGASTIIDFDSTDLSIGLVGYF